jgi:hypothetical protein
MKEKPLTIARSFFRGSSFDIRALSLTFDISPFPPRSRVQQVKGLARASLAPQ